MSVPPEEIITDDGKTHLDYCYRKEKGGQAVARKRNQEMDEENNLRENKTRHTVRRAQSFLSSDISPRIF